jgi:hypothetical protein
MPEDVVQNSQEVVETPEVATEAQEAPKVDPSPSMELPETILKKEAELVIRENTLMAKEALLKNGLPESLLPLEINPDMTKQNEAIDMLNKVWSEALKSSVMDRIKSTPPANGEVQPATTKKWTEMTYTERMDLYKSNPSLYKAIFNDARGPVKAH